MEGHWTKPTQLSVAFKYECTNWTGRSSSLATAHARSLFHSEDWAVLLSKCLTNKIYCRYYYLKNKSHPFATQEQILQGSGTQLLIAHCRQNNQPNHLCYFSHSRWPANKGIKCEMVRLQLVWHNCWHLPFHLWPGWGSQCDTGLFVLSRSAILGTCVHVCVCASVGCNCCCRTQRRHLTHLISQPGAPVTLFVCSLSTKCMDAHTRTEGMTHIRCTMSRTQLNAASHIQSHPQTHTPWGLQTSLRGTSGEVFLCRWMCLTHDEKVCC